MKNQSMVSAILMKKFGISLSEVISKTPEQGAREKNEAYLRASSEVERALMFGSEAAQNEHYKRGIVAWMQDAVEAGKFIDSLEDLTLATNRIVMDFFRTIFPDFDKGASIALGLQFKPALEYIKSIPGSLLRDGEAYHLSNLVMKNLDEKSNTSFFKKIRRNAVLHEEFKKRLDEYCVMWWNIEMHKAGTLDNGIVDAVRAKEDGQSVTLRAI